MSDLLLIHSDTTEGDTVIVDSGDDIVTIQNNGVSHSTTQQKYGATSLLFESSAESLVTDITESIDTNCVINFHVHTTSTGQVINLMNGDLQFVISATGEMEVYNNTTEIVTSTTAINDDAWHHICYVKNHQFSVLFIDGSYEDTNENYDFTSENKNVIIGGGFTGFLDEIRVINHIEDIYRNSYFEVPTQPYPVEIEVSSVSSLTKYDSIQYSQSYSYMYATPLGEMHKFVIPGNFDYTYANYELSGEVRELDILKEGIIMMAVNHDDPHDIRITRTDENGKYKFEHLNPKHKYDVTALSKSESATTMTMGPMTPRMKNV